MKDSVVLLPGVAESVLWDNGGRYVWVPTAEAEQALVTLGRSISSLELRDEGADDRIIAPLVIPDLPLRRPQRYNHRRIRSRNLRPA